MGRVAPAVLGVLTMCGVVRIARADPWTVTMEGGAEADSNVERVETGPDAMTQRIAAPVGIAGARIDSKDRLFGGTYVLGVSGLARLVDNADAKDENVMLYAGDGRWLHPLEGQPISLGIGLTAADAFAITSGVGARTFRNLGADGLVTLGGGEDRHLTLVAGFRDFRYKPDHDFDWRGPVATARLDILLWQAEDKTRSLELVTTLGIEARRYASTAVTNACAADRAPCTIMTALTRRDRYQRANAELDWVGGVVATLGYQLTVIDSNSYGQALIRHRVIASTTAELFDKVFGTITATLQLDQYPDGILIEQDLQRQQLTSLEDENRSSLQVRLARQLTAAWSLELRGAIWRDFGDTTAGTFRRELVYTGVVYSH